MAIGIPVEIGTASDTVSNTSITVTVGAAGVPAGMTILVDSVHDGTNDSGHTVTDSKGNTYVADVLPTEVLPNINARRFRCSNNVALVEGDTITVSWTGNSVPDVVKAYYVSGLDLVSPLTGTPVGNEGNSSISNPADSGPITTADADAIILGFLGRRGFVGDGFTEDSDFTTLGSAVPASTGVGSTSRVLHTAYRVVSATETQNYAPLTGVNRNWSAGISAYRAAAGAAVDADLSISASASVLPTRRASMGAGVGFSSSVDVGEAPRSQLAGSAVLPATVTDAEAAAALYRVLSSLTTGTGISPAGQARVEVGAEIQAGAGLDGTGAAALMVVVSLGASSSLSPAGNALVHTASVLSLAAALATTNGTAVTDGVALSGSAGVLSGSVSALASALGLSATSGVSSSSQASAVTGSVLSLETDIASGARQMVQSQSGLEVTAAQVEAAGRQIQTALLLAAANVLEAAGASGDGPTYDEIKLIAAALRSSGLSSVELRQVESGSDAISQPAMTSTKLIS